MRYITYDNANSDSLLEIHETQCENTIINIKKEGDKDQQERGFYLTPEDLEELIKDLTNRLEIVKKR